MRMKKTKIKNIKPEIEVLEVAYLDPLYINESSFESAESASTYKPRVVVAVGYLMEKTSEAVFIASTKNGELFQKILRIPVENIVEEKEANVELTLEVVFNDAQMIGLSRAYSIKELREKGNPPLVRCFGWKVSEDKDSIILAMEKNSKGNFRTLSIVPSRFQVKEII